jgi:hypothetical protein
MNDDEVITAVREQRDKVHSRTPVDQIISRGRTVRARRRIPRAAGGVTVAAAAAVALGLGLSGGLGASPARITGSGGLGGSSARVTGTIRTTAFTLTEHANGMATLTLNPNALFNPRVLRRDLRRDGIPAVVTAGTFCSSHPIPAGFARVVPGSTGQGLPSFTINPAAIPAGTELSFGTLYSPSRILTATELIDKNSYTCGTRPEPFPPPYRDGVVVGAERGARGHGGAVARQPAPAGS